MSPTTNSWRSPARDNPSAKIFYAPPILVSADGLAVGRAVKKIGRARFIKRRVAPLIGYL